MTDNNNAFPPDAAVVAAPPPPTSPARPAPPSSTAPDQGAMSYLSDVILDLTGAVRESTASQAELRVHVEYLTTAVNGLREVPSQIAVIKHRQDDAETWRSKVSETLTQERVAHATASGQQQIARTAGRWDALKAVIAALGVIGAAWYAAAHGVVNAVAGH